MISLFDVRIVFLSFKISDLSGHSEFNTVVDMVEFSFVCYVHKTSLKQCFILWFLHFRRIYKSFLAVSWYFEVLIQTIINDEISLLDNTLHIEKIQICPYCFSWRRVILVFEVLV